MSLHQTDRCLSWDTLHAGVAIGVAPLPALLAHRYGVASGLRGALGLAGALMAQEAFLTIHARPGCPPGYADALTLSRATAAAILASVTTAGVRDQSGPAGWLCWLALLWGETVSDWLDGPLARRTACSDLGALLDLEADSWLTLWAAVTAVAWGVLPRWSLLAPLARYALAFMMARRDGSGEAPWRTWWARTAGVAQMTALTAALCPYEVRPLHAAARRAMAPIAAAQLVCLAAQGIIIARARPPLKTGC